MNIEETLSRQPQDYSVLAELERGE